MLARSLGWASRRNGIAFVIGALVLLGAAAVGGYRLRTWLWPLLYPLPIVLLGVWLIGEAHKLNAAYEATEVGSLAPAAAALLALFCFAVAAGVLAISAIAVAVGKWSGRR